MAKIKLFSDIAITTLIIGFIGIGISGCGGAAVAPVEQEKLALFSVTDIQANLSNVKKAKSEEKLDYYSYNNFAKAESLAYNALSMHRNGDDKQEVYHTVMLSKENLAKANNSKAIIEKELKEVLNYKNKLDDAHADDLSHDEYNEFSESLSDMMHAIDDGEGMEAFASRGVTLKMGQTLYSKLRIASSLHNAEAIVNSIDPEIAPKSYQKAQEELKNAKFTINKFPDDDKTITEVSKEALSQALYSQVLEKEVKKLSESGDNLELYITNEHEKLIDIYKALDKNYSIKELSYSSKMSMLKDKVVEKISELQDFSSQNAILQRDAQVKLKALSDLNQQLNTQKSDNKLLQVKIDTLNGNLLKTKDDSLEGNSKLFKAQGTIALLGKTLQETNIIKEQQSKEILNLQKNINDVKSELEVTKNELKKVEKAKVAKAKKAKAAKVKKAKAVEVKKVKAVEVKKAKAVEVKKAKAVEVKKEVK